MNEIIKVEFVNKSPMPPGGPYAGIYSGYIVTIPLNDGYYQLTTKDGIRGSGPCSVMVDKDGNISFAESP